jgi:hypothetical protein
MTNWDLISFTLSYSTQAIVSLWLHIPNLICKELIYLLLFKCCDNLIPGMALWKQNLLTCVLTAAIAFEILSSWSYALRDMMVPLPKTVLKIVFRNTRSDVFTLHWMPERSAKLCPFRAFFNFGKSRKSQGPKSGEWSIFVMEFLARNSWNLKASCAEALSWWKIHLSGQSPGLFLRTDSRNLVSISK